MTEIMIDRIAYIYQLLITLLNNVTGGDKLGDTRVTGGDKQKVTCLSFVTPNGDTEKQLESLAPYGLLNIGQKSCHPLVTPVVTPKAIWPKQHECWASRELVNAVTLCHPFIYTSTQNVQQQIGGQA